MATNQTDKATKTSASRSRRKALADMPRRTIFSVLTGGVISSDFFQHHCIKILVAVVLLMIYISTKYQCLTGMETIRRLENDLEVVKTEHIRERARYMSRIRESSMAALADSVRPGLAVQQQPPFILHY